MLFVCLIKQVIVEDGHCRHGFHYGDSTGEHACIVAPAGFQGGGLAVLGYGGLFHQDGGNWFEGNAEVDVLSVRDASLYTATTVGLGGDATLAVGDEDIVLLAPSQVHAGEPHAVFKSLYGIYAEHGTSQGGMQLAEARFAKTCGTTLYNACDDASDGVTLTLHFHDEVCHTLGSAGVGTTDGIFLGTSEVVILISSGQGNVAHLGCICADADAQFAQSKHGKGSAHDTAYGFACRGAPAATMVAYAVFGSIGIVGVRGTEHVAHVLVVGTVLVGVPHHEAYGATRGTALKDTAEDFHTVLLLACRGETALPRATACQFALDEVHVHGDACRHAVDYTSYGFAMTFAEGGQTEYVAKCVHL